MVFQDYALFPHMTVADNIAYPLRIQQVGRGGAAGARPRETGAGLGLDALLDRRPGQLSGGQQQRVALARAIACQPAVFLFDEPLSNLDARLRLEARTFLKRLQRELGVTTVFVTHDQAEALALADRIAVMEAGRIRQVGTPAEVFHRPANTFVAELHRLHADEPARRGGRRRRPARRRRGAAAAGRPRRVRSPTASRWSSASGPEYLTLSATRAAGRARRHGGGRREPRHLGAGVASRSATRPRRRPSVPEGAEPAVGAAVWLTPQPGRALLYRAGDGELIRAAPVRGVGRP